MNAERSRFAVGAGAIVALAALALLAGALYRAESLPDGPVPVPWDRAACARCRMLVSDPHFAAQLQTRQGEVLFFDDPGDLLLFVDERALDVHAVWLHHATDERWVEGSRAAFVQRPATPMGFGLGAVERGEFPDALSWDEALAQARVREARRP